MQKDRDELDDIFRSKLYDFEEDVLPEDWEAIERRLPRLTLKAAHRTWYYWAAAACIALLATFSGLYFNKADEEVLPLAQELKTQTEQTPVIPSVQEETSAPILAQAQPQVSIVETAKWNIDKDNEPEIQLKEQAIMPINESKYNEQSEETAKEETDETSMPTQAESRQRALLAIPQQQDSPEKKPHKWSFGMGAGSLSAGNNSSVGSFALGTSSFRANETLTLMNAVVNTFESPKTDIHHKMPFSIGLSVSRHLSDRWALQTGLSYSLLASDWKTNTTYWGECKRRLHFLGIPLGVSYKIAEWNRFLFYASVGGKVELNVAGKIHTELNSPEENIMSYSEKQRIKKPYFSVNGHVGISYPIIRFISTYAEVGADYYFDNGSEIETYYTEKPFRVGLQIGFRFGF